MGSDLGWGETSTLEETCFKFFEARKTDSDAFKAILGWKGRSWMEALYQKWKNGGKPDEGDTPHEESASQESDQSSHQETEHHPAGDDHFSQLNQPPHDDLDQTHAETDLDESPEPEEERSYDEGDPGATDRPDSDEREYSEPSGDPDEPYPYDFIFD